VGHPVDNPVIYSTAGFMSLVKKHKTKFKYTARRILLIDYRVFK